MLVIKGKLTESNGWENRETQEIGGDGGEMASKGGMTPQDGTGLHAAGHSLRPDKKPNLRHNVKQKDRKVGSHAQMTQRVPADGRQDRPERAPTLPAPMGRKNHRETSV